MAAAEAARLDMSLGTAPLGPRVTVQSFEGDERLSIPVGSSRASCWRVETLSTLFPGAIALKYKIPGTGVWRIVVPDEGWLFPPSNAGWGSQVYVVVYET